MPTGYIQARFIQTWHRSTLPVAVLTIALLTGCSRPIAKPPTDDRAEVLIRHLLHRLADSQAEVRHLQSELLDRENLWLKSDIEELEGRPRPKHPPLKDQPPCDKLHVFECLNKMIADTNGRSAQFELDSEESIELYNKNHPDSPSPDLKEMLRETCGDCTAERALRDQQIKEEAPKKTAAVSSPIDPVQASAKDQSQVLGPMRESVEGLITAKNVYQKTILENTLAAKESAPHN